MTTVDLLGVLKAETVIAVSDLILPTNSQKDDEEKERAAKVYLMQLPEEKASYKKAPYIVHQVITGDDTQTAGRDIACKTDIRSVFCVCNDDAQEGCLMLLNLMERLRIHLLKQSNVNGSFMGRRYTLDLTEGLKRVIYPNDTWPYYLGDMYSTWNMPKIQREVDYFNGY